MPLRIRTSSIDVEVKMKPVGNDLVVPKPEIKMRTANGEPVEKVRAIADKRYLWINHGKDLMAEVRLTDPETNAVVPASEALEILNHYNYKLIDPKGNTVKEDDVEYYYIDDKGEEQVVRPFDRTKVLEIPEENWVPSVTVDDFVITSVYELFTDDKADMMKLWDEAERRIKEDVVGVTTFSHGRGFQEYYAFLDPVVRENKFVWLLKLTDTKMRLDHMMEIPAAKVTIKVAPTLKILPPIQAVVRKK